MAPSKTGELPKAVDFDQIMSKANLCLTKHSANLNHRAKPHASPAAKSRPGDNGAEKPKPSFSSLANKPSPQHILQKPQQQQRKTFSQPRGTDRDDDDEAPENSGIGHVPAGEEKAADARAAETMDLKGRLLGKRALEQKEEARKRKRARAKEDSSDEEEGRSAAVGKGRKQRRRGV